MLCGYNFLKQKTTSGTNKNYDSLFQHLCYLWFLKRGEVMNKLQLNWVESVSVCVCVCVCKKTICYNRSLEHGTAVYTALYLSFFTSYYYTFILRIKKGEKNLRESSSLCNYLTIFWAQLSRSYYRYRHV